MKNPALKKKKNWRNILIYIATYLVVTFSVTFVVVSFSNKTYSSNTNILQSNDIKSSALGMVVTNLMELSDANVTITANVTNDEGKNISLDADLKLVIYPDLKGAEVDMTATLNSDGKNINVRLVYKDKMAYVMVGDKNYSMGTESLTTALVGALSLCGIDIDLSADIMSSFDMSMMDGMADKITETEQDDKIILTIAMSDQIVINIVTDKDYNIKDVTLNEITFSNNKINTIVKFKETNSNIKVNVPDAEFVNMSESVGIITALYNTVKAKKLNVSFDVKDTPVSLQLDFTNDLKAKLNVYKFENNFDLAYINNNIYLNSNILKIKSAVPKMDIKNIVETSADNMPSLDEQQLAELKSVGNSVLNAIKSLDLKAVSKTETGYQVVVNNCTLDFIVNENKIEKIVFVNSNKSYEINISNNVEISVDDSEYTNVSNFEFLLNPIKEIFKNKTLSANVALTYNDMTILGTLNASFDNNKILQFATQVYGVDVLISVTENGVYLKADDLKVKVGFDSLKNILDKLSENKTTDNSNVIKTILQNTIKFIKPADNSLVVSYKDYSVEVVASDGKLDYMNIALNSANLKVDFNSEFKIDQNFEDYDEVEISKEKIENVLTFIRNKKYTLDATVSYKDNDIQVKADIDLSNGIKNIVANVKINAFDKEININVQDGEIYVAMETIRIYGTFDDISSIVSKIVETSTQSVENSGDNVVVNNIKLSKINETIRLSLEINENPITFDLNIPELSLKVNGSNFDVNSNVFACDNVPTLDTATKNTYVAHADNLSDLVFSALNTIKSQSINGKIIVAVKDKEYHINLEVLNTEKLVVKFSTNIEGIDIVGYYSDNKVYVNLLDVCFMFDLNNLDKNIEQLADVFNLDINKSMEIVEVLKSINLTNLSRFETDENSFKLQFNDILLKVYTFNDKISRISIKKSDINVNVALYYDNVVNIDVNNNKIIELDDIAYVARAFYNTFKSKSISGDIDLTFKLFDELNTIKVNYGVKFDGNITGYINTTFKGLDVNIYYVDDTFFLDVIGLKLKLKFNDIPELVKWINNKFGTDINVDSLFKDFNISDLSLDFITSASFETGKINAVIKDTYELTAEYTDIFNRVNLVCGDTKAVLKCTSFNEVVVNSINQNEYQNYTSITTMVDAVYNTIQQRKFDFTANTKVFRNDRPYYTVDISLVLDIIENMVDGKNTVSLNAGGSANVSGEKNVKLDLNYLDSMLYVNWEGLKLSMNKDSIKELLGIALQLLNIDTSNIPALDKIKAELDIDTDNLSQIVPTLNSINPLNYLAYIKSINCNDNILTIVMNGEKLNGDPKFNPEIKFVSNNGKLTNVEIEKLYTGVTSDENISINVALNDYTEMPQVNKADYVDISQSANLIKAFVNTSNLNDYTISGTVNVNATVIGINIPITVNVNAFVKVIDGKPVFAVEILDIPVITAVNYDSYEAPDSVAQLPNHRDLFIYYKDGYFYIHRTEKISRYFSYYPYEKKVMVNSTDFLKNITYYLLKFGFGFSDNIMDAVDDALKLTLNRETPINKGNVLKGFSRNGDTYSVVINMAEIANNPQLDKATINITTVNNASTNNKDYIGKLAFDLYMPLASAVTMTLKTDNLTLNNIGQEIDLNGDNILRKGLEFIKNYTNYDRQELVNRNNGGWKQTSAVNYTMTFDSCGGGNVNAIIAQANQPISLPHLSDRVVDDGVTKVTYTFAGWFTSRGYEPDAQYTNNKMCKGDITLYAKWTSHTEYYKTISFDTMGKGSVASVAKLQGKIVTLNTLADYVEMTDTQKITYEFLGWYNENFDTKYTQVIIADNITLYAKWAVKEIKEIRTITLKHGDQQLGVFKFGVGDEISLNHELVKTTTKYYLDKDFTNEITLSLMPSENMMVYVRNMYTISFNVNGGNAINSITAYEGEVVSLPSATRNTTGLYKGYVANKVKYRWIITTYTFAGWTLNGEKCTRVTVPSNDITLTANWTSRNSEELVKFSVHNSYKKKYGA